MKERPIIFSGEMVRAILEGRKTMTRRIIPERVVDAYYDYDDWVNTVGKPDCSWSRSYEKDYFMERARWNVGDILWVREKWKLASWSWDDGEMLIEYADGIREWLPAHDPSEDSQWLIDKVQSLVDSGVFKADEEDDEKPYIRTDKKWPFYPSIFMPREASRIFLEITDIKVERLLDISDGEVVREGVTWNEPLEIGRPDMNCKSPAQRAFRRLWQSINGGESWDLNPWVWCIEFKVVAHKPIEPD